MENYGTGMATGRLAGPAQVANTPREVDTAREFDVMEKEITRLEEVVGHLINRIDPICRPHEPTQLPPGNKALDRVMSPFADRLRALRARIGGIGDTVAYTNSRLDL